MKTFNDFKSEKIDNNKLEYLTEAENAQVDELVIILEEAIAKGEVDLKNIDEGIFGKLLGGAAGFLVGPAIGRIIAKALGIERGILYDMFNSRLVGTALGAAIGNYTAANKE